MGLPMLTSHYYLEGHGSGWGSRLYPPKRLATDQLKRPATTGNSCNKYPALFWQRNKEDAPANKVYVLAWDVKSITDFSSF